MTTYRLVVEYDGTAFAGLQFQPGERTVAGEIERALGALFCEAIGVTSAGRTDAGVHARGQVLSFRSQREFPVERLALALNAQLPLDCSVRLADIAPGGFSARFDARLRRYEYRIYAHRHRSAYYARFTHHVYASLDWRRAADAAQMLVGQHDFTAFCAVLPDRGGTIRTIDAVEIDVRDAPLTRIHISGLGFLHRMVRISVGTLVEIAAGKRPRDDVARILASRDRREAGYTAPACGLALVGVDYDDFSSSAS